MALLSVIYISNGDGKLDSKSLDCLSKQSFKDVSYVIFADESSEPVKKFAGSCDAKVIARSSSKAADLNKAKEHINRLGLITFVESGDTFPANYFGTMIESFRINPKLPNKFYQYGITTRKSGVNGKKDIFSTNTEELPVRKISIDAVYSVVPRALRGTWIRGDYFATHSMNEDLKYEFEKDYLYRMILNGNRSANKLLFNSSLTYTFNDVLENDYRMFDPYYTREYYYEYLDEFWVPFLEDIKNKYKKVPLLIQYQALYELNSRMNANHNNRNKHLIPESEAIEYLTSWQKILKYIDDEVILNHYMQDFAVKDIFLQRMLLRIKNHDENLNFDYFYVEGELYYGKNRNVIKPVTAHPVEVIYMECNDGFLHIDGVCADVFDLTEGEFECIAAGVKIDIHYTERYTHTKLFGAAVYKKRPFEIDVKIENTKNVSIGFFYNIGQSHIDLPISFPSHFSRLSNRFKMSYWVFKSFDIRYMVTLINNHLSVKRIGRVGLKKKEGRLRREMFVRSFKDKKAGIFLWMRIAYFFFRPFMKKRPIWLFFDKIYKGGDSAEYIYKYASKQDDGIDKYYLIDKNAADYERLKKEGYKPLVRGSFKHRLIFLYSDMVIASNSTIMEFNDYSVGTSSYIRDLINFDVVCVQHGMSIQKIAIAQNRLRDNIKLYFCASPYEIENLNHPVYDYAGRNILHLTGVPRFDGLKDRHKKQIIISPTWRMQAALAPKGNEGVERDYNPMFKQTTYFKIYNSLINDPRLINAAKEYGYNLLYVLHPIVSPQLKDFDKNDYVKIVPSVGDFSYEDAFCESSLMVTDYSGIQFDFAYMRKPVLYLHHKDMPTHYEEGTYHYDKNGFGEICRDNDELIDLLIEYMKNDCKMKDEYVRRADDFFAFSDNNNCSRIYPVMQRFTTDRYVEPEKPLIMSFPSDLHKFYIEGSLFAHIFQTNKADYKNLAFKEKVNALDRKLTKSLRRRRYKKIKVQKNKILFLTYDSTYICNPRYIAEEILRRNLDVDLVWGVPHDGRMNFKMFPERIRLVKRGTEAMFIEQASAGIWIDNALEFLIYQIPKKPEQTYFNTWHGSLGIKKLSGTDVWVERASYCNKYTDYCITNSVFEEEVFRNTFWKDTPFLKVGHARNDVFFDKDEQERLKAKLRAYYNLDEETHTFLYAPTFRENGLTDYEDIDYVRLKNALEKSFGGKWVILVRWHHKERALRLMPEGKDWILDASNYGDMQELLPAIDAGMSDYSSWVYDYILMGKPVFLYIPDVDNYDQVRGFYYPLETTPFPLAKTNNELVKAIETFDDAAYEVKVKKFLEEKGCYEEGTAAKRIVDKIEEIISGEKDE